MCEEENTAGKGQLAAGGRASPSTGCLQLLLVQMWVSLKSAERGSQRAFAFVISVFPLALKKASFALPFCKLRAPCTFS